MVEVKDGDHTAQTEQLQNDADSEITYGGEKQIALQFVRMKMLAYWRLE